MSEKKAFEVDESDECSFCLLQGKTPCGKQIFCLRVWTEQVRDALARHNAECDKRLRDLFERLR